MVKMENTLKLTKRPALVVPDPANLNGLLSIWTR